MRVENLAKNTEDFTGNVWKLSNRETVLVDVGTGDSWKNIQELEKVDKVVITHSHYDHIDNLEKVVENYHPTVYAFEPRNLNVNAEKLEENDEVKLAGAKFKVFHTPGHKNDSICLYSPEEKIVFTGDLLFPEGSFGRTDLEEGNRDLLIESIEKIAALDVKEMYCGHDNAALEDTKQQIESSLKNAQKHESKY